MVPTIVWFRHDLRVDDHPALSAAISKGNPVIALYILDDLTPGMWKMGGASRWWLHHSLVHLKNELKSLGIRLVLRKGEASSVLFSLIQEVAAAAIYWTRCYEPFTLERDARILKELKQHRLEVKSFSGSLLVEPWEVTTQKGDYFKVFTPFWKACLKQLGDLTPLPKPNKSAPFEMQLATDSLSSWELLPQGTNWARSFSTVWEPGTKGAKEKLQFFINESLNAYEEGRNYPAHLGTSRLSPHLRFGEISPKMIAHCLHNEDEVYLSELGWREFSYHLLYHFPKLPQAPFNPKFKDFPWDSDPKALKAWQRGMTGYPIVDAGMRQLWTIGWMHNRVRMIVASFLTKDLMIPWQEGEAWFWDTLVDADLASNSASWQWVAGCGADAAPYFRIFNPILQGKKFDPEGTYIRKWVPEIASLPLKYLHAPWEAPEEILKECNVNLGKCYPFPLVDHQAARQRALIAFEKIKS